ncbi:MAG: HAMP domain-containing histidine kinase [Chloroflexi bacterium]|nr:MAG: HAMP domain-containing histidine kinase [Chloroflexota bacterium]
MAGNTGRGIGHHDARRRGQPAIASRTGRGRRAGQQQPRRFSEPGGQRRGALDGDDRSQHAGHRCRPGANPQRPVPSGGSVIVSARRSGDKVSIAVRDTGEGIPEEVRSRVFDRFVKGPGSPGAGLGLAIAKDIVTAHGGSIDLTSEVGKGTEVRVTLPIAS